MKISRKIGKSLFFYSNLNHSFLVKDFKEGFQGRTVLGKSAKFRSNLVNELIENFTLNFSDVAEMKNEREVRELMENGCADSGYDGECPASPITVPAKTASRSNSLGSQMRSPKPQRQRTTSTSQNTIQSNEGMIRANNRTIYTAGRPPWYNCAGQQVEPFVSFLFYFFPQFFNANLLPFKVIGICGGSASGKTTVAQKIIESLNIPWVTLLSMDCFYKILNEKQHQLAQQNEYNFDHPESFDIELMADVLKKLKEGRKVDVPIYNFVTHSRETVTVSPLSN